MITRAAPSPCELHPCHFVWSERSENAQIKNIRADSSVKTPPRLYFHLNIAKITQSLTLTDAITDDSNAKVHPASSKDTIHANTWPSEVLHLYSVYYFGVFS